MVLVIYAKPKLLWDFISFNSQSTWNRERKFTLFTYFTYLFTLLYLGNLLQFNRFLVACIFMEECLIVCASAGLESETGLSSPPVSCAWERSESQNSMRFSLVYTSILQSLIAWVFM